MPPSPAAGNTDSVRNAALSRWRQEIEWARAAAHEAGRAIMRVFGTKHTVFYKSPDQPQTAADLEADRILHDMLLSTFPDDGWLSEESVDDPIRLQRNRVWIVDPIDGTTSYVAGRREFAISIGLAEQGRVVLGVVYNPATDELCWAVDQGGAYDGQDRTLHVSATTAPPARLAASRAEIRAGEFDFLDQQDWPRLPLGSTACKLAVVAQGRADVFLSRGPKSEWDVCAGDLIVREAGGMVTDLLGRTLHYNRPDPYVHGVLGSNGLLHERVLTQLTRAIDPQELIERVTSDE